MADREYFIGKIPPPLGGVTVFNQRRFEQLKNSSAKNFILIEPQTINLLQILKAFLSGCKVHISGSNFLLILLVAFFAKKDSIIFYDHNSSRHFFSFSKLKKRLYIYFFVKCKNIVLVDFHLRENYKVLGQFSSIMDKFTVLSAFLPPTLAELPSALESYDHKLLDLYKHCIGIGQRKFVLTGASHPSIDIYGQDIYSLELLISIFSELSKKYPDFYFLIAIAAYTNTEFSKRIEAKVQSLKNVRDNLLFLEHDKKIWPLFEAAKLFIRATTTDGDSVSLKEAIYFGTPVLASDVVPRVDEVMLFNLKNDDLKRKIEEYLGVYE